MKKNLLKSFFLIGLIVLPAFCFGNYVFPDDAKTVYVETEIGTGGVILPASDHDRTMLYSTVRVKDNALASIKIDGNNYISNQKNNTDIVVFAPVLIPAGQQVLYAIENNKLGSFRIVYVDYVLSNLSGVISDGTNIFKVDKAVDYGEMVIVFFAVLFLMLKIFELVFDFFLPKVFKVFSKNL